MRAEQIDDSDGARTFALVFDIGDEVAEGIRGFAEEHGLHAAHFTAIGALQDVTLGYWEWETKRYHENPINEQVEVVSLIGNVALGPDDSTKLHAHIVVGKRDGSAHGGHLLRAHVRPTLEVVLVESPGYLRRRVDPRTGLALIDA